MDQRNQEIVDMVLYLASKGGFCVFETGGYFRTMIGDNWEAFVDKDPYQALYNLLSRKCELENSSDT